MKKIETDEQRAGYIKMTTNEQVEKLEAAGLQCRVWKDRVYVADRGRELGYITENDDGSTGTCKHIKRAGYISGLLRSW